MGTEYLQFIGNNVDGGLIYISADSTHPLVGFGQILIANNIINMTSAAAAAIEVQPNGISGYWIDQFTVIGNQILSAGSSAQVGLLMRGTNIYSVKGNSFFVHGSGTFQPYYIDSTNGFGVVDDPLVQAAPGGGAITMSVVQGAGCWWQFPQSTATTATNLNLNYQPTSWSGSSGASAQLNIGNGGTNSLQLYAQDNAGGAAYVTTANTCVIRSQTGGVSLQPATGQSLTTNNNTLDDGNGNVTIITANGGGSTTTPLFVKAPSLTAGNSIYMETGLAQSTNNSAAFGYSKNATLPLSMATMSVFGGPLVSINGNGLVSTPHNTLDSGLRCDDSGWCADAQCS